MCSDPGRSRSALAIASPFGSSAPRTTSSLVSKQEGAARHTRRRGQVADRHLLEAAAQELLKRNRGQACPDGRTGTTGRVRRASAHAAEGFPDRNTSRGVGYMIVILVPCTAYRLYTVCVP